MGVKFWQRRKKTPANDTVLPDSAKMPKHIAIIMDGNGRWAQKRGLPRTFGHKAGAETLRAILTEAADLGVGYLTAYAFSTENWRRPTEEVAFLMELFADYLDSEVAYLVEKNVRLRFIGSRDRLNPELRKRMIDAEQRTAAGTSITLNLAVDYGGRAEIVEAARNIACAVQKEELSTETLNEEVFSHYLFTRGQPDPDLLIRPGGDMRISNFLLWQLAYAELWVVDVLWPDFTPRHFRQAIIEYQNRDRRFGGLMPRKESE